MRHTRMAALTLSLVTLLTTLCGCHGSRSQNAFTVPDSFDESRQYEITFWAKNDTNKTQVDIYSKAIADFHALYPNITVKLRLYTDYGKIYNDVITNIATNTTPNVCITYPDHIATYLTGDNVVAPLDALFADEQYGRGGSALRYDGPTQAEMIPRFLEECSFSGSHYAVPFMRSTEACYVNKTYVEALGYGLPETLTWDFVWAVSDAPAAAKNAAGHYTANGQQVLLPFIYKATDNMMIQLLRQKNAGYSTDSGDVQIFNDTTEDILYDVARHTASGAFSTFKICGYPANFLNAGQCLCAVDSTAGATWIGSHAPLSDISADKYVDFETAVMAVPQCDPDHPQMISQGPSVCVFNKKDSQEVLASWLFTQYLLTNEVQTAYSETEGYVPVTSKAQESDQYQDYLSREGQDVAHYDVKIKAVKMLLANSDNTFVTPVYNGSASLRDAAGQLIENVTKSVRRKETVDDAYMDKLFSDVTSLYRLDGAGRESVSAEGAEDLGPLPGPSRALLLSLCAAWALIGAYTLHNAAKKRNKRV